MKPIRLALTALLLLAISLGAAAQDDMGEITTFTVTIENVSGQGIYENSGVMAIPIDGTEPGPALPGSGYSFTVNAEPGATLSFVTMLAQSNDLFFAPDGNGIALYDDMGSPISGDITDQVHLWDAGTEVNEPIGEGANQAPRQAGPNTGDDEMGVVNLVADLDDGLSYPATADVISVEINGMDDGSFTVSINNVSDMYMVPSPITPVVWIVRPTDPMADDMAMDDDMSDNMDDMMAPHGVFFTRGQVNYGRGLEHVAEDGDPSTLATVIVGGGFETPITPVVYAVHDGMMENGAFFNAGEADRGEGLEALAEDGSPVTLAEIAAMYASSGVAAIPDGISEAGPALPGGSYSFSIEATPGQYLSFATMFVQSNDLFFAPDPDGIPLFDDMGSPKHGNVTMYVHLWDAGTEVNEAPGEGPNQPLRQAGPNTGDDEMGVVTLIGDAMDGFDYPVVPAVIRVSLHVVEDMMEG